LTEKSEVFLKMCYNCSR